MDEHISVRATTVEDIFYPSDKDALVEQLNSYAAQSKIEPQNALAVLVPHAAFSYVGQLLSDAYQAASDRNIKRVVLIGPIHRDPPKGVTLPVSGAFQSPLGNVLVDLETCEELRSFSTLFVKDDIYHLEEHCLEIQLPFIQRFFPEAQIVPVLTGVCSPATIRLLAQALLSVFEDGLAETLFVVTANIATMRRKPHGFKAEADHLIELIGAGDWEALPPAFEEGRITACGICGISTLLSLGNLKPVILGRCHSELNPEGRGTYYASIALIST